MAAYLDFTAQEVTVLPGPDSYNPDEDEKCNMFVAFSAEYVRERRRHELVEIEPTSSHESYDVMAEFAEKVDKDSLFRALRIRHPFAAFRRAVENEGLLDQWYAFKNENELLAAKMWLEDNGIDFVDGKIVRHDIVDNDDMDDDDDMDDEEEI